jgi:hypothetical protein
MVAARSVVRVVLGAIVLSAAFQFVLPATASPVALAAPGDDAMAMAYLLSELEAAGDFNALYDLIHPDAHAVIPRDAVVGWYFDYFAPRGASPATITGVRFVSWQWPVMGEVYPVTAEVSYTQEFWDGGAQMIEEDVVRLVQDDKGTWRWFFGRSPEFVQEMIDAYVEPYPTGTLLSAAVIDVGSFWAGVFAQANLDYSAPDVLVYQIGIDSICDYIAGGPATYCPYNNMIYVDEDWYAVTSAEIGDFAWVTILAHEWGHHVQDQMIEDGLDPLVEWTGTAAPELEADCLAGVYAQDAETRGWLETGDLEEAVTISMISGGEGHGSGDDRMTAFMTGYLGGLYGCGLTL